MPAAIAVEVLEALAALAPQLPEISTLVESTKSVLESGTITDAQAAAIRDQLDAVHTAIDTAS